MTIFMEEKEILDEIRQEFVEHNRIQRIVAEQLEKAAACSDQQNLFTQRIVEQLACIGESLPISFVPVERKETPGLVDVGESVRNLRKALELVREILDGRDHFISLSPTLHKGLFEVEALLSAELGQPVWEERK